MLTQMTHRLWPLLLVLVLLGCSQGRLSAPPMTPTAPAVLTSGSDVVADRLATPTQVPTQLPSTHDTLPLESTTIAQGRERVVAIGKMAVARASHSATLLPDGRVLIAGGCTRAGCEMGDDGATAELYDPSKGAFTPTGRMTTERVGHTATLLSTGKVLIVGGFDRDGVLAGAELYDPATSTFTTTGSMSVPRAGYSATILPSGKVLIVGGFDGSHRLTGAELYDPGTGTFTTTGGMATPRAEHATAPLADGRILVTGGSSGGKDVLASAEIYDPKAGTFGRTEDMMVVRYKHAATTLRDGKVLIVGGSDARDGLGRYASTEIYDPVAGTFQRGPPMAAPRYKLSGAVALLTTGEVLVGGGDERVEVYAAAIGSFRTTEGSVGAGLAFTTATLLADGRVVIVGGYDERINPTTSAWVYDPLG